MVQIPHVVSTDSPGGGGGHLSSETDDGPRFPSENSTEKVQEEPTWGSGGTHSSSMTWVHKQDDLGPPAQQVSVMGSLPGWSPHPEVQRWCCGGECCVCSIDGQWDHPTGKQQPGGLIRYSRRCKQMPRLQNKTGQAGRGPSTWGKPRPRQISLRLECFDQALL